MSLVHCDMLLPSSERVFIIAMAVFVSFARSAVARLAVVAVLVFPMIPLIIFASIVVFEVTLFT